MTDERCAFCRLFDRDLLCFKQNYLTATECLALMYLGSIAAADGRGHVYFGEMAFQFGRVQSRCRHYLRRPKRYGIIEWLVPDGCGGAEFKLFVPIDGSDDSSPRRNFCELVRDQHPANLKLAPKCSAA